MSAFFRLFAGAFLTIITPAFAQTVAAPPIGAENGMSNMPKTSATVPDRVRTPDVEVQGGMRVRSELADKLVTPLPVPMQKEHF